MIINKKVILENNSLVRQFSIFDHCTYVNKNNMKKTINYQPQIEMTQKIMHQIHPNLIIILNGWPTIKLTNLGDWNKFQNGYKYSGETENDL